MAESGSDRLRALARTRVYAAVGEERETSNDEWGELRPPASDHRKLALLVPATAPNIPITVNIEWETQKWGQDLPDTGTTPRTVTVGATQSTTISLVSYDRVGDRAHEYTFGFTGGEASILARPLTTHEKQWLHNIGARPLRVTSTRESSDPLETIADALNTWDMWALEPEEHQAIREARQALAELRDQPEPDKEEE
jgi:hypothetical protein